MLLSLLKILFFFAVVLVIALGAMQLSETGQMLRLEYAGTEYALSPVKAVAALLILMVLAWLVFNGYTVSTLGQNFSQVVFQFRVSPELLWTGLKWALGIGLVGGLFPALRAARLPVTEALRAA